MVANNKDEVIRQALALSEADRLTVVREVEASLSGPAPTAAERAEWDRRWADYKSGKTKAMPADEAVRAVRESLRRHREQRHAS